MTADERELYTAVETYIAGTWNQATATERPAVGFVMTIYRRRLATVTIGETIPYEAPCLCLGPKGVSVAEEYLEARFRLYRMVYMHKTTRAAERMLEKLLKAVAEAGDGRLSRDDPVLRYLTSENPTIGCCAFPLIDHRAVIAWAASSAWFTSNPRTEQVLAHSPGWPTALPGSACSAR